MKVGTARKAAADWVRRHVIREDWFRGAYFSGSTVLMEDEVELPASSDMDVVVVTAEDDPPAKPGKFLYDGVLLEITFLGQKQLTSAEVVLTSYHLAGSFRRNTIIEDPTGLLRRLYEQVSERFAQRSYVMKRCMDARKRVENFLQSIDASAPWHDQVTSWLFATGVTAHVVLVAALRNPTVRLRYVAAREVLLEFAHADLYEEMLGLLGCREWSPKQTERHLNELARTFDAAASVAQTPFFFRSDITVAAKPIVIDGSRGLIKDGFHREAVFWMVATFARCHKILAADAPHLERIYAPAFEAAVTGLGIETKEDLLRRADGVRQFLPRLWSAAEDIIHKHPEVIHPL
ncbi:hypothetical protein [Marinicrinis lubricantis]|uniref:Polymerase nucleotidyl transferase domain-containing protein n=1 Tax=Marinicrinis lubricantis TaxID=2086470 RepID=A0ABW1IRE1_9BACL